ncbi:hypothetical protein EDEG_02721 [Edhazardia aedis USNM 41457]|uniref:Uncharacterized protein n=1 Tax=Edhazardia aedis (strain USNM 41457) TaxID=1003232 RepID=J9DND4_EDHAE|nr:hypothetical protein EDEG_02721 [Edhazardia aedis USNM 41457]|eukprot:EJW02897.1 hypothetical protein EDEG_02721 [Edhazardia aedis USNM 41457]
MGTVLYKFDFYKCYFRFGLVSSQRFYISFFLKEKFVYNQIKKSCLNFTFLFYRFWVATYIGYVRAFQNNRSLQNYHIIINIIFSPLSIFHFMTSNAIYINKNYVNS